MVLSFSPSNVGNDSCRPLMMNWCQKNARRFDTTPEGRPVPVPGPSGGGLAAGSVIRTISLLTFRRPSPADHPRVAGSRSSPLVRYGFTDAATEVTADLPAEGAQD